MQSLMESIYGPLSVDYCIYFYFLSVFGFVLLVFTVVISIFIGLRKGKDFEYYMKIGMIAIGYAIFYFQNRLLYHMCAGEMVRR